MKTIWDRIHVWLAANAPQVLANLNPGAAEEQIRPAEQAMGVVLPEDVKSCAYRIHNGQFSSDGGRGVLYGEEWLSLERMVRSWRKLKRVVDDGAFKGLSGRPHGPIRSNWWHLMWIPVTADGSRYKKCLDLAPRSRGKVGQVISWCHERADRGFVAKSFPDWLAQFAALLEAGRFAVNGPYVLREID